MPLGSASRKHPPAHIAADIHAKQIIAVEQILDLTERPLQYRRVGDNAAADWPKD
jgi:hypothetical protein